MEKANLQQMNEALKGAKSMNEILDITNAYYDFDETLGIGTKGIVLVGIKKVIQTCRIKERDAPMFAEEE